MTNADLNLIFFEKKLSPSNCIMAKFSHFLPTNAFHCIISLFMSIYFMFSKFGHRLKLIYNRAEGLETEFL